MATEPKATVAELLHAAFLRGEKIAPTEFGKRIGVSRVAVHLALRRHFAGMVREEQPNGTRIGAVLVCLDAEEMRQWKPKPGLGQAEPVERHESAGAEELRAAWGIRPAEINRPATQHLMTSTDRLETA